MNDGSDSVIKWRSVILLFWNGIVRFVFFPGWSLSHMSHTSFKRSFVVFFLLLSPHVPSSCLYTIDKCYYSSHLFHFQNINEKIAAGRAPLNGGGRVYGILLKINTMEKWCFWESGLIHRHAARGWFGSEWSFTVTTLNGCQNQCHNIHCVRLEMPDCWRKRAEPNFRK